MKRIRLIVMVVVVMVIGVVAIACFRAREPRYQGRTLWEWIQAEGYSEQDNAGTRKARHAIKQMAPDAIPVFLKWAQAKDTPFKLKMMIWSSRYPVLHLNPYLAEEYHIMALHGFKVLGSDAKPAWPVLIQWTSAPDADRRVMGLGCLAESKPDKETLLPVLLRLIHDPDKRVQSYSAYILHYNFTQDAEASGVYKLFPEMTNRPTINTKKHIID